MNRFRRLFKKKRFKRFFDEEECRIDFKSYCQVSVIDDGYTEYGHYFHDLINDDVKNPYNPKNAEYYLEKLNQFQPKLTKNDYTTFHNAFKREVKPYVYYDGKNWQFDDKGSSGFDYIGYLRAVGDAIYYTLKDKVPKEKKFYYC